MNQRLIVSCLIALSFLGSHVPLALADAREDLAAGRTALGAADFDKALPLLKSAAEALPDSVEAQLALGDCYLQLGQVDDALAQFRAVVKLSPQHARANKLVEALTARHRTLEQKLAAATELVKVKSYQNAINILIATLREPLEPAQRETVRLRVAETYLLWGNSEIALSEAVQLVAELSTDEGKAQAHAIAALAAAGLGRYDKAKESAAKAEAAPQPWKDRLTLITLLADLDAKKDAAALSRAVGKALSTLPDSTKKDKITKWIFDQLSNAMRDHIDKVDPAGALAVLWPMVSGDAVPGDDSVLKPVKLAGGWLGSDEANQAYWLSVAELLSQVGESEMRGPGRPAPRAFWLAGQVIEAAPAAEQARGEAMVRLIERLAGQSNPAPDRQPGTILSPVDAVQRQLIITVAPKLSSKPHRDRLVNATIAHIQRYAAVNDLPTGVSQFVTVKHDANQPKPEVNVQVELPRSEAQTRLIQQFAAHFQTLGEQAFNEAARSLDPAANTSLQRLDTVALVFFASLNAEQPTAQHGAAIVQRYAGAEHWDAAAAAIDLLYAANADAAWVGRFRASELKIRRALAEESARYNLGRRLDAQLHPLIRQALTTQVELLRQSPTEALRAQVIQTAQPLIDRYLRLDRRDLAEQMLTVLTALPDIGKVAENADLRDWALWTRASIAGREAAVSLARTAKAMGDKPVPLDAQHKVEIALLNELVTNHPGSAYVAQVVGRITTIASLYESYRSFDTSASVLADFIKAHPKIDAAEQLEYVLAIVSLKKARVAFGEREDKSNPPKQLSAEFTAAIKAISDFLKAHPTGKYATQAEAELLSIARQYGQEDAWPVARQVIAQMAAAGPDANQRRTPGYIRLLEAATYLGELDQAYGLHLLSPAPKPTGERPDDGINALALANSPAILSVSGKLEADKDLAKFGYKELPDASTAAKPAQTSGPAPTFSPGAFADDPNYSRARDSELALVMVRRSEQQHLAQIARLGGNNEGQGQPGGHQQAQGGAQAAQIHLPSGVVLS